MELKSRADLIQALEHHLPFSPDKEDVIRIRYDAVRFGSTLNAHTIQDATHALRLCSLIAVETTMKIEL